MSMLVTSPPYHYEEEEPMNVFESTAAEFGAPSRPRMPPVPDFSIICAGKESKTLCKPELTKQGSSDAAEKVKVFLRIRPLSDREKDREGEECCVSIQDNETLLLKAPKDSQNMKNAERGIVQSIHRFSFTKIFAPETSQQEMYEATMKSMVRDVLQGQNRLLYTYGVTNSGKTYTIQGSGREAGLLPRALVSVFRKVQGRLYSGVDLKPAMHQDVRQLSSEEIRVEESRRDALLKEDVSQNSRYGGTSTWDSGVAGMSTYTSHIATQLEECDSVCLDSDLLTQSGGSSDLDSGVQFSIWVAFYEIYNEFLYDLLEAPPPNTQSAKKRNTLRLSEDKQGNPYVKDLTWVQVRSADEAWRVLKAGRTNQSFASTHLNSNSSRSHSIFSLRLLHVHPEVQQSQATRISELTIVDLAGSERCKDQRSGERMKEASNINTSLHTLGRCIAALRNNQSNRSRAPQLVPFRDSKLTRVLQGFFCGRGTSCMVVNINPCSSIYDETLQALKFSAIATQLVHGPSTKSRVAYILSLLNEPASTLNASTMEEEEEEEEEESDGEEEEDVTMLNTKMLLEAIDVLKREVWRQRAEKDLLEGRVREEVVDEMMEHINTLQSQFSERLELERDMLEERHEDRIENLKKNLKEYYSQQLESRDEEIKDLSDQLEKQREAERRSQFSRAEDREASLLMPPPIDPPAVPGSQVVPPAVPGSQVVPVLRRSTRSTARTTVELTGLQAELTQCRAELMVKTQELRRLEVQLTVPGPTGTLTNTTDRKLKTCQRNLRQLRVDLQRMGSSLQASERACCRNTGGERLRRNLSAADETLAKQDQILVELQNSLQLVKADLRRQADTQARMPTPCSSGDPLVGPGRSCKKRVCGANVENHPPLEKRPFLHGLLPQSLRTPTRKAAAAPGHDDSTNHTPSSRILRSRQQSPMVNSPAFRKY